MRKLSIKIITLASLTVGLGLYFVPTSGFSLPSHEIKSTKAQNSAVPVALPSDATIILNGNKKISGKITEFDQQQSLITLERSNQAKKVDLSDIQKVEFTGKVIFIHNGESLTIRGGDNDSNPNTTQTWQEPFTHFKITNAQNGKAEVILSNISKGKLRGIITVSQTNTYVVDELSFDHDNNHIILTVIPYSE
ncbi:MAG: hypothetical protein QNJ33_04315 [Crocosphaera sp.]|nr:hypothetical protein [Crocosphaera sp.]